MSSWLKDLAVEGCTNTFRQITGGVGLVVAILLCAGLKHAWPDCPPSAYAVVALAGVLATVAAVAGVLRAAVGNTDLLFDFSPGEWRLVIVGFGLAFAVALGLFGYEWHDQKVADAMTAQRQAEQDAYHEQLRSIGRVAIPPRPTPRR